MFCSIHKKYILFLVALNPNYGEFEKVFFSNLICKEKKSNLIFVSSLYPDKKLSWIVVYLRTRRLTKSKNSTKKRELALKKRWRKWKMQLGQRSSIPAVYIALPSGG